MIQFMEKINLNNPDPLMIPDALMIRPKIVAVFDNIKDTINVMTVIYPEKNIKAENALKIAEGVKQVDEKKNKARLERELQNKENDYKKQKIDLEMIKLKSI